MPLSSFAPTLLAAFETDNPAVADASPSAPWALLALTVVFAAVLLWRETSRRARERRTVAALEERHQREARDLAALNAQLVAKTAELEQLNEVKTEFLGIAAHDIRNPLGVVLGLSEILVEQAEGLRKVAPETAESLVQRAGMIRHSAQHMAALVSQLLDTVALESGKVELALFPQDMAQLAETVVESHQLNALKKQISISIAREGACTTAVDPERVWEIFENLLTNAIKFSPPGRRIWVRVADVAGGVRFSVRDEGPGLTAKDRERVFGRFQRLSARPTAGEHSTGLGLSIVKTLVEMHRGRLWVESEPGQGATFVAEFPAA